MTAPSGLGLWMAYRPANALMLLKQTGAAWVAPRAGLNGWDDPGLTVDRLQEYRDAGVYTAPWIYPTMTGWRRALDGFARLHATGLCDGLIVDAEAEWCEPDAARNAAEAKTFVAELRRRCPDAWIAHAPMDYVANHPTFPWVEFGALDAVMPQVYAYEHDDRGHAYHLERVEKQWLDWEAAHPEAKKPRWPIGCTYRPKTRGYDATGRPIPLPAWPNQSARVAADVAAFLDHPLSRSALAPSLYSLEAAPPEVIAMLAARVVPIREPGPTHPDTPANPIGRQDRAEAEADDDADEENRS